MTRTIPSQAEMERSRKRLTFRNDHHDLVAVLVELMPDGLWYAGFEEDDFGYMPGSGETMMAAIADLREQAEQAQ